MKPSFLPSFLSSIRDPPRMDAKEKSEAFWKELDADGRVEGEETRRDNTITTKLSQHIRRCKSRRSRAHVSTPPCTDRETSKKKERKEEGEVDGGKSTGKKKKKKKRKDKERNRGERTVRKTEKACVELHTYA